MLLMLYTCMYSSEADYPVVNFFMKRIENATTSELLTALTLFFQTLKTHRTQYSKGLIKWESK